MANINLLPWREELREQRKQQFVVAVVIVLAVAVGIVFLVGTIFDGLVDNQRGRNDYLQGQITELDKTIAEISTLKKQRQELIERMKIIQDLQGNRAIPARILEQFVTRLPEGVYFTSLEVKGDYISLQGASESNNQVSNLMRDLDESEWLTYPTLTEVKATTAGQVDQANTFQLSVTRTKPDSDTGAKK